MPRNLKEFLKKKKGYCSEGRCSCLLLSAWRDYDINGCDCEDGFYPMPTSLTLSKTETTLVSGETDTITATVLPEEAAKFYPVLWTSDDETVATVNNGIITYVGAGTCTITATAGDKSATVSVLCKEPANYLCFTAAEANSTVQLTKEGTPTEVELETSTDGTTWSDYTIGNTITLASIGDKVYMRNKSETPTEFSKDDFHNIYYFQMGGGIAASGDIDYLLCKNSTDTLVGGYCFANLFKDCSALVSAPELPATTLTEYCYMYLFSDCTSLTTAPELPATELASNCYNGMFYRCENIKISETQDEEYVNEYRIPVDGTGVEATDWNSGMFLDTGGTFTGDPVINTTYYTSNTVI